MSPDTRYHPPDAALTERLSAYLDDALAPNERSELESRLARDADARHQLEGLREIVRGVRGLETIEPSPGLDLRAVERLAMLTPRHSFFEHSDGRFSGLGRQATFLFLFALILSFSVSMWYYVAHLYHENQRFQWFTFDPELPPTSIDVDLTPGSVLVGARVFKPHGRLWVEKGLDPTAQGRLVLTGSDEGRLLLIENPGLRVVFDLHEVLALVHGEILHLQVGNPGLDAGAPPAKNPLEPKSSG